VPPQVPETAVGAEVAETTQVLTRRNTEFHETATDRQRFQVHIDFGRVFESQGNYDAALLEYQEALSVVEGKRRGPFRPADSAMAHRRMGAALDCLGRFAQAEVHYQKALKLSPKDPKIWNDAGYSYYLQGRWADAERTLKTAAKLAPEDERIRINLGLTLAAAGKPGQALPLLSQTSGDATGHANLGYLLAATGQTDLARRQYETALAMRPNFELATRAIAQLDRQERGGNQSGAAPTLMAQGAHVPAPPRDPGVNQASAARNTIPPPAARSVAPALEAPSGVAASPPLPAANAPFFSELPPPPAL
jgi:Flp pilus assembly protein TadD